MPSTLFLELLSPCARAGAEGMELCPHTRPYLDVHGRIRVRLVWRRRGGGRCETLTHEFMIAGGLSNALFDAIVAASG